MAWIIDNSHSEIQFSAKHLMISTVRGRFNTYTGTVEADEQNPTGATVDVQIDASSLVTGDEKRDGHLRSPDFLDVEKYPHITFKSTRVERTDETNGKLYGDLTIRDVTRPVVLDIEYAGQAKTPWGTTSAGFSAQTKINRKDFGLNWNVALETGGWLVGDQITISIELELVKQVEQEQGEPAAVAA
ncbi:MAG TPA: YceI family protein [Roseiflexaceae bacterium]